MNPCYNLPMTSTTATTFDQLDYLVDLDDRVVCNGCPHAVASTGQEFVAKDKAQRIKDDGQRLSLDGDRVEVRGQWVVMSWREQLCGITNLPALPAGTLHRCSFAKPPGYADMHPEQEKPANTSTEAAWWE